MTIKLSTALMAHPSRKAYVEELLPQLDKNVPVVWDQHNDRWLTGRASLLAYDPTATHHLVLQDDAVVPRDLISGVERMLSYVPATVPVCLYTGRSRPYSIIVTKAVDKAVEKGASWLRMWGPWWGVGVVTPTAFIPELVEACDTYTDVGNYDLRMERFWRTKHTQCLYSIPSLVDHRSGPSLVPGRGGKGRHAHMFLGVQASAAEVPWSTACLNAQPPNAEGLKGEVRAIDPEGKEHVVTAKAYREALVTRGWTLASHEEMSHVG